MSSDLLVNSSAMTALLALNQTQQSLNTYENQVSTGLAISGAKDNAAYWSIATSMSSQVDSLNAVSSALSESAALLSTMNTALQQTVTVVNNIKTDLQTASNLVNEGDTADLAKTQSDINSQIQSLLSLGQSTNVNGVNFLMASSGATVNLLASYNPTSGAQFITIDTGSTTALFNTASTAATTGILGSSGAASGLSVLNFNVTGASAGAIANMLTDIGSVLNSVTSAGSVVGAAQNNVTEQQNFISNLTDSLTSAVGSLVDADMNQASTKISALQVQQQLGVQALSIANSNTQLILKLFGL
ncbi:flagellin [uncultured Methylovirgula sp.]|uniref:flagellin N-terminal helical domain-containing protein n=1 Tax=uncultured Methylovirgula sp. TaxID=1285960 RepID=UPI002612ADFB|nr:flagellin [uncultured Methylovirgula sp.]